MIETIADNFSCKSWLLIKQELLPRLIHHFEFEFMQEDPVWQESDFYTQPPFTTLENYMTGQKSKILVSSSIHGYLFVEGQLFYSAHDTFCRFLSQFGDIYFFCIDIWIPVFTFALYRQEKPVRKFEFSLDIKEGEDNYRETIEEYGEILDFEKEELKIISPECGYDYFFYPISIMNYLGISNDDLYRLLNEKCSVYKVNDKYNN